MGVDGGVVMRAIINDGPIQISDSRERPEELQCGELRDTVQAEELKHRTSASKTS